MTNQTELKAMPDEIWIANVSITPHLDEIIEITGQTFEGAVKYIRADLVEVNVDGDKQYLITPADGDAERALEDLNACFGMYLGARGVLRDKVEVFILEHEKTIRTALHSTRKTQTEGDGEPATYWSTKQDFVHPVPVDTIAVSKDVLQEVRDNLKEVECHESCGHRFRCYRCEALASLDAVLSEGE